MENTGNLNCYHGRGGTGLLCAAGNRSQCNRFASALALSSKTEYIHTVIN